MSCNMLQCLTLFKNVDNERSEEENQIVSINYEMHLSPFKITNDLEYEDWKRHSFALLRKRFSLLMPIYDRVSCFENENIFLTQH